MSQLDSRYFPLLLDVIDQSIFSIDKNGVITFFNHAAEELTGYRAGEIIGTGLLGALASAWLVAPLFMGKTMALATLIVAFSISTIVGTIIGIIALHLLPQRLADSLQIGDLAHQAYTPSSIVATSGSGLASANATALSIAA